jgi:hypothetical protein
MADLSRRNLFRRIIGAAPALILPPALVAAPAEALEFLKAPVVASPEARARHFYGEFHKP